MYDQTIPQKAAEAYLEKQGFRFLNWVATNPDANNEPPDYSLGTMVMVRQGATRFGREYREIVPDGSIH